MKKSHLWPQIFFKKSERQPALSSWTFSLTMTGKKSGFLKLNGTIDHWSFHFGAKSREDLNKGHFDKTHWQWSSFLWSFSLPLWSLCTFLKRLKLDTVIMGTTMEKVLLVSSRGRTATVTIASVKKVGSIAEDMANMAMVNKNL